MKPYLLFENGTKISLKNQINKNVLGTLQLLNSKFILKSTNNREIIDIDIDAQVFDNIIDINNNPTVKYVIDSLDEEYHIYDIKTHLF